MNNKTMSEWGKAKMDEWHHWQEEGNEPKYDDEIVKELTSTIYDKEFQKNAMDTWDKKHYSEFRDKIIKLTFETVYYPEAVWYLENWNIKFSNK